MGISPFSRSQKRYIRKEKARIRREVFDTAKKQELIEKLLEGFLPKPKAEKQKKAAPRKVELATATKEQ